MYPIRHLFRKILYLLITSFFSFVLTFSHVIVYDSIGHDFYHSGHAIEKLEKSAEMPLEVNEDEAPEHLNTIFFTDFLTYHTYSLKIHLTEIRNYISCFDHSIHSDSFIADILRPPIFA